MEKIIEFLNNTNFRDTILEPYHDSALLSARRQVSLYKWTLSPSAVQLVKRFGITANPLATVDHPHPIHKTVETHLLYETWRSLAREPSTVLYMKPEKFSKLQNHNSNFSKLINQHHVAKDFSRYPTNDPGPVTTRLAFMHDALMYFSQADIASLFRESPSLHTLYASVVHPAESELGLNSFQPDLYTTQVQGNTLHYFLEGKVDGSYTQPLDCNKWLYCNRIRAPDLELHVSLLSTHASFHHLQISRVSLPAENVRFYSAPDAYVLPQPKFSSQPLKARLVPRSVYDALFTYVRAVRTLRVTDPAGVIRTQRSKEEHAWVDALAWDSLTDFALQTSALRSNRVFGISLFPDSLYNWFVKHSRLLKSSCLSLLTTASFCASHYFRNHKLALVLFGRAFTSHTAFKPKLNFQCDFVRPRSLPFKIPMFLQSNRWLQPYLPGIWPRRLFHCLTLACAVRLAWLWFFERSPQEISDSYLRYVGLEQFRLSKTCRSVYVPSTPVFFQRTSVQHSTLPEVTQTPLDLPENSASTSTSAPVAESAPPPENATDSDHFPNHLSSISENLAVPPPVYQDEEVQFPERPPDLPSSDSPKPLRTLYPQYFWGPDAGWHCTTRPTHTVTPDLPAKRCLLIALSKSVHYDEMTLWLTLTKHFPLADLQSFETINHGLADYHLDLLTASLSFRALVRGPNGDQTFGNPTATTTAFLSFTPSPDGLSGHWEAVDEQVFRNRPE
uniref:Viral methyltransferase n=1 Tax=Gengado virus TaxID=2689362 RepID=A0A6B9KTX3_9VIRU|nr:viral methyltransferase [Gengado virus]